MKKRREKFFQAMKSSPTFVGSWVDFGENIDMKKYLLFIVLCLLVNMANGGIIPNGMKFAGQLEMRNSCISFEQREFRWVDELLNHLVFADPDNNAAKKLLKKYHGET